jgi:lysophospholipase L1-like esterase
VIGDQIGGSAALRYQGAGAAAPWVAWGPYLWADGLTPRTDGLTWACSELQNDGTHPSDSGRQKVAAALLDFVQRDATARLWYLR